MAPKFISRCLLVVINITIFSMSGLLLYFGIVGQKTFNVQDVNDYERQWTNTANDGAYTRMFTNSSNQTESHTTFGGGGAAFILNPFKTVLFIASFMLATSFLGLYAAFSYQRKSSCKCTLFLHIIFNFVGVACLVYGTVFVLIFADDADEIIVIFWKFTRGNIPSSMSQSEAVEWFHNHLSGAAGVLIFSTVLLLISIICDSHLLGHDLTARKIVITTNFCTVILGILLIAVSAMNSTLFGQNDSILLPYLGGGVGGFAIVVSSIGIAAVWKKRRRSKVLCCYAFLMFTLTASLITVSVMAFQRRDEVKKWVRIKATQEQCSCNYR